MATLLMLSGGADSAAALIQLLTADREPVFCHHIIIADRRAEPAARLRISPAIRS
jgi:hypothetical protein